MSDYLSNFTAAQHEQEYTRNLYNFELNGIADRANASKAKLQAFPRYTVPRKYHVPIPGTDESVELNRVHIAHDTRWDETVGSYIAYGQRIPSLRCRDGAVLLSGMARYIIENYFLFRIIAMYAELVLIPKFVFAVKTRDTVVSTDDEFTRIQEGGAYDPDTTYYVSINGLYESAVPRDDELDANRARFLAGLERQFYVRNHYQKKYFTKTYVSVPNGTRYDPSEYYYVRSGADYVRANPEKDTELSHDSVNHIYRFYKNSSVRTFYTAKYIEYKVKVCGGQAEPFVIYQTGKRFYKYIAAENDYEELQTTPVYENYVLVGVRVNCTTDVYTDPVEGEPLPVGMYTDAKVDMERELDANEVLQLVVDRFNYIMELYVRLRKLLKYSLPTFGKILAKQYTIQDVMGYILKLLDFINGTRSADTQIVFSFDRYNYGVYELKRAINAVITSFLDDVDGLRGQLLKIASTWSRLIELTTFGEEIDPSLFPSLLPQDGYEMDPHAVPRLWKAYSKKSVSDLIKFVFAVPTLDTEVSEDRAYSILVDKITYTGSTAHPIPVFTRESSYAVPIKMYYTKKYMLVQPGTLYEETETYYVRNSDGTYSVGKVVPAVLDSTGRFYASASTRRFYVVGFVEYKIFVGTFDGTREVIRLDPARQYFTRDDSTGEYSAIDTHLVFAPISGTAKAGVQYFTHNVTAEAEWYEEIAKEEGESVNGLYTQMKTPSEEGFKGSIYASLLLGDPLPEGIVTDSPDEMEREINVNEILPLVVERFNAILGKYVSLLGSVHVTLPDYTIAPGNYDVRELMTNMTDFIEFRNNWRESMGLPPTTAPIDRNLYTVYNLKKAYNSIIDMYKEDLYAIPDDNDTHQDDFVVDRKTLVWDEQDEGGVFSYNELNYFFDPNLHIDQKIPFQRDVASDVHTLMDTWAHVDYRGSIYILESFLDLLDAYNKWKDLLGKAVELGLSNEDKSLIKTMQSIYNRIAYEYVMVPHCGYVIADIAHHLDNLKVNDMEDTLV